MTRLAKIKDRLWIYLLGALLTAGLGWLLTRPIGDGLARLSYDLPFLFQSGGDSNVVLVMIDSQVKQNLGESPNEPLDRRFHAQLIERLRRDGARLILFDLINFDQTNANAEVDQQFMAAARAHERVVLMAPMVSVEQADAAVERIVPIVPDLANAVAAWGLANADDRPDGVIRRIYTGNDLVPSASWAAAKLLDAPVTRGGDNRLQPRWLNYYGRAPGRKSSFQTEMLDHALAVDFLPPGFFREKIVVIGFGSETGLAGATQDTFSSPYTRFGDRLMFGAEVQATILMNLLHGDWLERMNPHYELLFIALWGCLCVLTLSGCRPWNAALLALAAVLVVAVVSLFVQLKHHLWWSWLVPVVQLAFALVWSVGYQYFTEDRRRRRLRRAFGSYLSPYMADQIADSEFDLALGGKEVEATVMFTDLEGFTKMSESLPPAEVSKILTTYFDQTTGVILEQDGTIIKYIGDAVMAVWGAPLPDPKHAERAVLAAWGMSEAGKKEVAGRRLRTRIGVNSGLVLAGNLGSKFRFDYTLIGDTTNFAARLEGLNKYLGTDILISDSTRAGLSDLIRVRPLGKFLVVGKKMAVGINEVLGLTADLPATLPWLDEFARGLESFTTGNFSAAEQHFQRTIELRGGQDGPARLYLAELKTLAVTPPDPATWNGTVVFHSK